MKITSFELLNGTPVTICFPSDAMPGIRTKLVWSDANLHVVNAVLKYKIQDDQGNITFSNNTTSYQVPRVLNLTVAYPNDTLTFKIKGNNIPPTIRFAVEIAVELTDAGGLIETSSTIVPLEIEK